MKTIKNKTGFGILGVVFFMMVLTTSCEIYVDDDYYGRDGIAKLSVTYYSVEPTYIEVGQLPSRFEWGRYYTVSPGSYSMYYEGEYYRNGVKILYDWEVDYKIWREYGDRYHDAPDLLFTIECNPNGPYIHHEERFKSTSELILPEGYSMVKESNSEIVVEKKIDGYGIQITYRDVERRKR